MMDSAPILAEPELTIQGLSAGYARKVILRDITLTVSRGECVAILGPNGSGKSTLLKTIMGFATVAAGSIHFAGSDITNASTHHRVQMGLSYLIQGGAVFPTLSVRENLEVAGADLTARRRDDAIDLVLSGWPEISRQMNSRAGLLSGGQRQALAVAMALVRSPRVLLLDEPSAGLAPGAAAGILQRVMDISRSGDVTTVVVEHRIRDILRVATRAVILNNGIAYAETRRPSEWLDVERIEQHIFSRPSPSG
jgi:ABC-type branched-subunit amino acid transport system ATPase component